MAVSRLTRIVRGCAPLADRGAVEQAGLRVALEPALGSLECGAEAGQVSRFRAVLAATGASLEAACGEAVVFSGLSPATFHEISIDAFEADASAPRWGTRCWRSAQAGVTLDASCDLLSETGALSVDVAALLAALELSCGELVLLRAVLDAEHELVRDDAGCPAPLVFSELLPGEHRVIITITSSAGADRVAECTALVAPGRTTLAACATL
jgi:hypothetical protein